MVSIAILGFGIVGSGVAGVLTRNREQNDASAGEAVRLVRDAFRFAADVEGAIPGASRIECGNWLEHDLENAKREAAAYLKVLEHCSAETMVYPE